LISLFVFVLHLSINFCWMQSVLVDKRPEKTEDSASGERGPRISQTFRHIGLFLTFSLELCRSISREAGTTAQPCKRRDGHDTRGARPMARGGEEAERLFAAFGAVNHESEFDWKKT
jgi:hypothetical protein